MRKTRLGSTGLMVTRTAFGALPIQRVSMDEAKVILRNAYEAGINFFDTARAYSDSEEKIGNALSDVREDIVIATKSGAGSGEQLTSDVHTSLEKLKTDYIDVLQLHNAQPLPEPGEKAGRYDAAVELKKQGLIRHIGISNHRVDVAAAAVKSGNFETLQFPLSMVSAERDLALVDLCKEHNVGFIAMKAMAGGLIRNTRAAFAFLRQFDNVVPIWGIQRRSELDEWLRYDAEEVELDDELRTAVKIEREELAGDFCRACGYCLPCPVEIPIPMAARMSLLLRRMPSARFLEESWRERMLRIENCLECGQCASRCPYGLDTPGLLKKNLEDYKTFLK
jgi:aryl-alcohol dehydrogenase-like predicted oxidoreductase